MKTTLIIKIIARIAVVLFSLSALSAENYFSGFSLNSLSSKTIYTPDDQWKLLLNNSSSSKFFIPTRTQAEWDAFIMHRPSSITVLNTFPESCNEIKVKNPNSVDGTYSIDPEKDGSTIVVFCDMTTDNGGWTLIGRTASPELATTSENIGWGLSTGSLSDFNNSYSLGVANTSLSFNDVLVGQRTLNSNLPGYNILKRAFSRSAMMNSTDSMIEGGQGTWIQRISWGYDGYPWMQHLFGYTGSAGFYMRDCCGPSSYGVQWYGMVTTYCGSSNYPEHSGPYCGGSELGPNSNQVVLYVR